MTRAAKAAFPPWLGLVSGVLAVSGGAIFARLADAPALTIAAYRTGLATLCLLPIALLCRNSELRRLDGRAWLRCLCAGFFLALHFATWISSLEYAPVANSVVLVNTNPLWVGLLTPWLTAERLNGAARFGIVASLAGVAIIGAGDFATSPQSLLGDALALSGGICAAIYLLLGRSLRHRLSLLSYATLCYGAAALMLWLMVLALRLPVSGFNARTWGALVGMALVSQIIGHTFTNWALRWFSASLIAVSLLGEPIIGTLLAYLLFSERVGMAMFLGGGLILTAIVVCAKYEQKASAGADATASPEADAISLPP